MPLTMKPIAPVKPLAPLKQSVISSIKPTASKPQSSTTQTFSGLKTLSGGLKQKHTAVVTDLSSSATQYLPYHVHCNTCGFESKLTDMESAVQVAKGHVGA